MWSDVLSFDGFLFVSSMAVSLTPGKTKHRLASRCPISICYINQIFKQCRELRRKEKIRFKKKNIKQQPPP